MTIADFTSQFEEKILSLEKGQLRPDFILNNSENWDSMAIIETMAFIDHSLGIQISIDHLLTSQTFGDILHLLGEKLN
ncbi:hypothetical protein [Paenibacillus oleatilyticus]|uniref:hypothetical protein n=1 Tax=Paenibacillus oleatilyticus TaxID=2594886 RepID=UPI001C1F9576|nr:hypothetical protein [Paenibacillus oleatilyticus]MBU7317617.1 hypothetical protein [Paenibacillus oleatilyticus]